MLSYNQYLVCVHPCKLVYVVTHVFSCHRRLQQRQQRYKSEYCDILSYVNACDSQFNTRELRLGSGHSVTSIRMLGH